MIDGIVIDTGIVDTTHIIGMIRIIDIGIGNLLTATAH